MAGDSGKAGINYGMASDVVELWHSTITNGPTPYQEYSYWVKIPGIRYQIYQSHKKLEN